MTEKPEVTDKWGTWVYVPSGKELMDNISRWLVNDMEVPDVISKNPALVDYDVHQLAEHASNLVNTLSKTDAYAGLPKDDLVALYVLGFMVGHAFHVLNDHEEPDKEGDG